MDQQDCVGCEGVNCVVCRYEGVMCVVCEWHNMNKRKLHKQIVFNLKGSSIPTVEVNTMM